MYLSYNSLLPHNRQCQQYWLRCMMAINVHHSIFRMTVSWRYSWWWNVRCDLIIYRMLCNKTIVISTSSCTHFTNGLPRVIWFRMMGAVIQCVVVMSLQMCVPSQRHHHRDKWNTFNDYINIRMPTPRFEQPWQTLSEMWPKLHHAWDAHLSGKMTSFIVACLLLAGLNYLCAE